MGFRATSSGDDVDTSLVVNINDIDDEAPVFDPNTYSKSLWEKETVGKKVIYIYMYM